MILFGEKTTFIFYFRFILIFSSCLDNNIVH